MSTKYNCDLQVVLVYSVKFSLISLSNSVRRSMWFAVKNVYIFFTLITWKKYSVSSSVQS